MVLQCLGWPLGQSVGRIAILLPLLVPLGIAPASAQSETGLVNSESLTEVDPTAIAPTSASPMLKQPIVKNQGKQLVINGMPLSIPWVQWELEQGGSAFALSDVALRALGGIDLLNTDNPQNQPIAWRESPLQEQPQRLELSAVVTAQARYVDLTPLQQSANWQVSLEGDRLKIQTRSILQITNLLLGRSLGHVFGPHDIQWAPGIRWQQRYVRQGGAEFPVTLLYLSLKPSDGGTVSLAPIWPADEDVAGIASIVETAANAQVAAALNGGFFNRNNKTPLGAIRQEGHWVSGPILNRGAIAWDDQGNVVMDRLQLEEVLVATQPRSSLSQPNRASADASASADEIAAANAALNTGTEAQPPKKAEFSLISLNSGYLKAGFSRYNQDWGTSYVPLTDNEVLIYVKNGEVIEQRETQLAGEGQFPIPQGNPLVTFLVVARSNRTGAAKLPVGTRLRLKQQVYPPELADYPHGLGGGPLLLQGSKVVLDAAVEGFSQAFIAQRAPRSAAVSFADGKFALVTVHERVGGKGPTLAELAQLLQSIDAQDALNLDGGSSTQLLLGGQIINRNPWSAARVHNGLGVFIR